MTKVTLLNSDLVALVDDDDLVKLANFKWRLSKDGPRNYAIAYVNRRPVRMHRIICQGKIDHIDGDGLNNQRSNLRPCTDSQNQHNRRKHAKAGSVYKGVGKFTSGKWRARIRNEGVSQYLGQFETQELAAAAYDRKAKELFGEFACLNFK